MTTQDKILEAADRLFGRVGFDAATTRQIADTSGVNRALIHYHFRTKSDLFEAIMDRYYGSLTEVLLGALRAEGDVRDRFAAMIDSYVDFLAANRNFSQMVQREAASGRHLERIMGHTAPLFEGGIELLRGAYPNALSGELAGPQLLVSFYGMIASYFTFSPVLEQLLGNDPLSESALRLRKAHLKKMMDLVFEAMTEA